MLWLLGATAAVESSVALLLVSKVSPLVQLGQKVVEGLRSSRSGAAVVKTLSGAMLVLLASDLSSVLRIRKRMEKTGATDVDQFAMQSQLLEMTLIASDLSSILRIRKCMEKTGATPVDRFAMQPQLLEMTLIGSCLLLELTVSSLHSSLKAVEGLTRNVDVLKKQARGAQAEYLQLQDEQNAKAGKGDEVLVEEVRSLKEIVSDLREKLGQVQGDVNSKEKELKSAKANLKALEKQTEGFQNEYTRMMDNNENLRIQLSLFDRKYANSDTKKYS